METIEKITKQIEILENVEWDLSEILEHAGQDCETVYPKGYQDMLEGMKALNKSLQELLEAHNDVIMDADSLLDNPKRTSKLVEFAPKPESVKMAEAIFIDRLPFKLSLHLMKGVK